MKEYAVRLPREESCDVLVVGGGIAGLLAALRAAEDGAAVTLAAAGGLFSGSSFYPGTWGLGLVGPDGPADEADLTRTIRAVGCGMASPELVETFVRGITPAIEELRTRGVRLRRAAHDNQKEFIPCFDHKRRDWNGLEYDSIREILGARLAELGVRIRNGCEVVELVRVGERVCGAVVFQDGGLHFLGCRALVLATGGYGSLFRRHLCTEDVTGQGQALALEAGASLVNMEFLQMMPGYLSPAPRTIFNEKTFRFVRLHRADGTPLLPEGSETERLLALRSTHGPFTARLESRAVDIALFQACREEAEGVTVTYKPELRQDMPEFIATYFDWLEREKGITPEMPIHIGIFAHAANGGIAIRPDASTGVPGLFACGEVTGGMHGADRIGGLSTANGLVFGGIAGHAAAAFCLDVSEPPSACLVQGRVMPGLSERTRTLQEIMSRSVMILRNETGLQEACERLETLADPQRVGLSEDPREIAATRKWECRLLTARCVLQAALARRESRGSHYREDFPEEDPACGQPVFLRLGENGNIWMSEAVPGGPGRKGMKPC
ncbi:MAG: FAD-binding protein [Lachnospiraceae bacterium]|nr:FAD-binding protein [Lachnospiraceae bacterium]